MRYSKSEIAWVGTIITLTILFSVLEYWLLLQAGRGILW